MSDEGYLIQPPQPPWWKRISSDRAISVAALLISLLAALFSFFQYRAANRQARAAEEQVRTAQATLQTAQNANDLSRAFFGTFVVTPQPQLGRIAFDLGNSGKAIGIISSVTADLKIQKLSDSSPSQQEHREWHGPIPVQSGFGKWFDINGKWPTDPSKREQAIWRELWQDIITVSVQVSYDSGFGKMERQSFCQTLVADERINGPGKRLGMTNQNCEESAAFIEARRKQLGLPVQP